MAADAAQRLRARRDARFHVQVGLEQVPINVLTPAEVPVEGRVIRIFRGDGRLALGDRVTFTVPVCREGDEAPPGSAYLRYDDLVRATHMEAYLNGQPRHCEVPLDECTILTGPREEPSMTVAELEQLLAGRKGTPAVYQAKQWWQFWKE
jgi:hypothetical protein